MSSQKWSKKNPDLNGTKVPPFVEPVLATSSLDGLSTSYDFYKLFQPDTYVNKIIYQSKLYATQKDCAKKSQC